MINYTRFVSKFWGPGHAEKWLELTERTFNFACYARKAFMDGDIQTKKEILVALGLNPTIINKRAFIEANKWFIHIKKGVIPLIQEFRRFELDKRLNHNAKLTLDDIRLRLRGRRDLNPQPPT